MIKIKVFICFFFLFSAISGSSQNYNFKNYFPEINGLVQSVVRDVVQDKNGYLDFLGVYLTIILTWSIICGTITMILQKLNLI